MSKPRIKRARELTIALEINPRKLARAYEREREGAMPKLREAKKTERREVSQNEIRGVL